MRFVERTTPVRIECFCTRYRAGYEPTPPEGWVRITGPEGVFGDTKFVSPEDFQANYAWKSPSGRPIQVAPLTQLSKGLQTRVLALGFDVETIGLAAGRDQWFFLGGGSLAEDFEVSEEQFNLLPQVELLWQ